MDKKMKKFSQRKSKGKKAEKLDIISLSI